MLTIRPAAQIRAVAVSRPAIQFRPDLSEISPTEAAPGPYDEYGRSLTSTGGILIVYKDLDLRLRQYAWRGLAWSAFTAAEGWYLTHHSPIISTLINLLSILASAIVNWLILRKPSECRRQLEVRPDCLIIEGVDVFWRRYMEAGLPALQPDEDGNQRLCGIYGTRFVEFLTIRRFDELDRAPEVIASHLTNAFEQLWAD